MVLLLGMIVVSHCVSENNRVKSTLIDSELLDSRDVSHGRQEKSIRVVVKLVMSCIACPSIID